MGRPSLAPGVYFRLLLVGHFEGLDSERGIAWRAADSLGLRDFLRLELHESAPDRIDLGIVKLPSLFEARPNGSGAAGADNVVVDIENLDDRAGCELIAARAEFQCGSDCLRPEENAARVVPVVRESE
jgi:hypothetical protein